MKRLIVFAIAAPVAAWVGMMVIGKMKGDEAGTTIFTHQGFLVPTRHGLLAESMAAGALVAYLTAR